MGAFFGGIDGWTIASQIVCYSFIILFIWGATVKFGRKNEFNDDFTSLEVMKSLRGFAAIGVIIHHISQEPFFQEEGVLSAFVNAGAYFVAIFFFCSGFGLIKSLDAKKDYLKGFIRKRIVKSIVVPFYVNVLIYGILMFIVKYPLDKVQWLTNLTGFTMMNRFAWFPIVLAILYLVFFLCFRFIKNRPVCFAIIFVFILAMGVGGMCVGHFAYWAGPDNWWTDETYFENNFKWWMDQQIFWFNGEWWVNAAPAFLAGLVFANYEKQIVAFFKKTYALKFHILLIITLLCYQLSSFGQSYFGYWTEWDGNGYELDKKIITFFCQVPLFLILVVTIFIFMMKYHVTNPVTRFFGKYSLHTYLMNLAAITVLRFVEVPEALVNVGDVKHNLLIYGVSVMILSVLMGVAEQKITESVQNKLFSPPRPKVKPVYISLLDDGEGKADIRDIKAKPEEETADKTVEIKAEDKSENQSKEE
ncbi:MAG: acyltransferase [Clostridiales bacterium]|nr:acyltransferase [Clostridiales bacterium]